MILKIFCTLISQSVSLRLILLIIRASLKHTFESNLPRTTTSYDFCNPCILDG